ncbi:hypothetical protein F5Y04DRAFT_267070 [Hypomontagnella monticulosa]|nr:hypothetical protein F5Y04DRAFT_267070 [Hypomontagnella monticulosa]
MTENSQATEDAAAARAAEQARLRKERREAKLKAGGTDRLNKIMGLGGGVPRDPQPKPPSETTSTPQATTTSSTPSTTNTPAADQHGDPEEVDISQHYYEPQATARPPPGATPPNDINEAQLRQLMLGLNRPSPSSGTGTPPPGGNPFEGGVPPMPGMEGMEEDPMMKMLSQLMSRGGMPGGPGGANPFAGTGMESLLSGLGGMGPNGPGAGPNPMQQAQQVAANKTANLWRILHAMFAIGLGLYVAFSTTFTGTLTEREHSAINSKTEGHGEDAIERTRAYFFYVFTTVEALLLTARYFLDTGREPPKGWMWTVSGFLPGQLKGYSQRALRYGQILSTVRSDALVCVFVLGVCSWLRS